MANGLHARTSMRYYDDLIGTPASMRPEDATFMFWLRCYLVAPIVDWPDFDIEAFDDIILLRVAAAGKKLGALAVRVRGLRGSGISFGSIGRPP